MIGKARGRRMEHGIPREWTPVLDVHQTALRPDCIAGYCWLQYPHGVKEVRRTFLEFWYDPPGCALTDQELALLRTIAAADEPVMFRAEGRSTPAEIAFDNRVDVLRDLKGPVGSCWRPGRPNAGSGGTRDGATPPRKRHSPRRGESHSS